MSLSKKSTRTRALLVLSATVLPLAAAGIAHAGDDLMQQERDLLAGTVTSKAILADRHDTARTARFDVDAQQSARQVIGAVTNAAARLPVQNIMNDPRPVSGDAQALARTSCCGPSSQL